MNKSLLLALHKLTKRMADELEARKISIFTDEEREQNHKLYRKVLLCLKEEK